MEKSTLFLTNQIGATFTPLNSKESQDHMYRNKQQSKSYQDLFKDRDIQNLSHLTLTYDQHTNIRDDRLSQCISNETRNNTEKPRIGILDVIEPANAAVEEARVRNAKWQ